MTVAGARLARRLLLAVATAAIACTAGTGAAPAQAQDDDKFLGAVNLFTDPQFTQLFNQVTPENAGKWGVAAGQTRDAPMRWANLDASYDFAQANGFPFNFHVLLWGNQQPTWMEALPPSEQLAEIDKWFAAVAERYPDIEWLQVVNEPTWDPPDCEDPKNQGDLCFSSGNYLEALGGYNGTDGTGWDWILNAFRMARRHFPDTKLMINDVLITNSHAATTDYLEIIEVLQSEDLVDAIGIQGHSFVHTAGVPGPTVWRREWAPEPDMAVHEANLDRLAATGLPIQVTELDIDGVTTDGMPGDEVQLADYRRVVPTFWEHPGVEGITLWGWRQPSHWRNAQNAPIVSSTGELKPAGHWLLNYVDRIAPMIPPGQSFAVGDDVNDPVGTVEADDWASEIGRPELRTFSWEITGGTGADVFAIESSTGEIRVANPELLDPSASPYSLAVRVSDGFHTSDEAEVTVIANEPREGKFLGGVNLFGDPMFTQFFNQVTPENAGKWGSAAGLTREAPMRWANLDASYDFADDNGFPFNFHVLVWGNQQPTWMESLPPSEQLAEIDRWFTGVAERYPGIDWVQVVNEPLHDPPDCEHPMNQGGACPSSGDYLDALGGHNDTDGTGWDWVLNAFRLARQRFGPDAKLMINDYSITNSDSATTQYLEIIDILQSEDLVDVIGVQGHAFSTTGNMATHRANLDRLAATGLPIQVTELDIDGLPSGGAPGDEVQLADYRRIFPTFWEHPAVEGITAWGWRQPNHWRNDQNAPIVLSTGELKPAAHWLLAYVNAIAPVIAPGQSFALGDDVGDPVGTVDADDWAAQIGRPELRTFSWEITGGTGAEVFAIESSTGVIRVANPELLDPSASPYSLAVRVSDGFHTSDEAEVTISLPNSPPAVDSIAATPSSGDAPLEVDFSVSASDPDEDELSYDWDFGDGSAGSSEQDPTHTYDDPGTYEAEVTVSDGEAEVSDSVAVIVNEPDPPDDTTAPITIVMLNDGAPQESYDGDVTATFTATDPGPDASGVDVTEFRIDFGQEDAWQTYNPLAPPVVSGLGEHRIDYRSNDVSGNVEQAKSVAFEISGGEPKIAIRAPNAVNVRAKQKLAKLRFRVRNSGDAASGPVRLCVKAPKRKLALKGKQCFTREIPAGQTAQRRVKLRVKPKARGRKTRVKLVASGPNVATQRTTVRVRAKRPNARR